MKRNHGMNQAIRNLNSQIAATKRRISQSMSDAGYANYKCRGLQKKLARLQAAKNALRRV
ncbi:MAG: hypothetical protein COV79_01010 [Parcubacteria group bacterium CG11_big_fil_rev_8_21_14_0_20_41_14]|nr:MAG: hypothetical protein COV79_01010 [Parcubacteria group bacterium CG11_big_fil_rev_8_21_14_0_20_41_14]